MGDQEALDALKTPNSDTVPEASASSSSDPETTPFLFSILVSEPLKQGEGINAYISYKIKVTTDSPSYNYPNFEVVRRYSDFVWIRENLCKNFPGVIIPPLPEKLMGVGRFSDEFIENRRRALEKFLNRVAAHHELQTDNRFQAFLESNEEGLVAVKKTETEKKKAEGGFMAWVSKKTDDIAISLGSGANIEKTEEDIEFDDLSEYIEGFEMQMTVVHKHTQGLVKRGREMAKGLGEFGLAFKLLGDAEERILGKALSEMGGSAEKLSLLAAEQAEKEALGFEEPIHYYIDLVGAVKEAIKKRTNARNVYHSACGDLEGKKAILLKTEALGKDDKTQAAEAEVEKATTRVNDTLKDFNLVTSRVKREVEKFKIEKLEDFKKIILDYVQMQIEYNQKVEQAWSTLIPELEDIKQENDGGDGGKANPRDTDSVAV